MNSRTTSKLMVLTFSLLGVLTALAADVHKASLQTLDAIQVNGKQLPAGEYQVKWEGDGPNVQVSILKGKNVVASTEGHVITLEQKAGQDAIVAKSNSDGTRSLTEIRFGGKKIALALGEEAAQADAKGDNGSK